MDYGSQDTVYTPFRQFGTVLFAKRKDWGVPYTQICYIIYAAQPWRANTGSWDTRSPAARGGGTDKQKTFLHTGLDGGRVALHLIPEKRRRYYLLPWRAGRAAVRLSVPALGPPPARGRQAAVLPSPPPHHRAPGCARLRARHGARVRVRVRARASSREASGLGWELAGV